MNLELFVARRLLKGKGKNMVSVPIVKIALIGIALGVCVMLLSVFVITGFKKEITDKLSGFYAHLTVTSYGDRNAVTGESIEVDTTLWEALKAVEEVKEQYVYVTKPAILKSKKEIHGVLLNGVDSGYEGRFFRHHLKAGTFPDYRTRKASNDILISAGVAGFLDVGVGEKISAHFVQDPPRLRSFTVRGIYDTGFKEYDDVFVVCDLRHLQKLNGWKEKEVSGIALELKDIKATAQVEEQVAEMLYKTEEDSTFYKINTLQDTAPQLFEWLELINMNVWIILILLVTVAGFNMVSGLLILILDRTSLIGLFKALGCKNVNLRRLFLYMALGLVGRGMLWGNGFAFLLGGIQYFFKVVRLDPAAYYMDTVPVSFHIGYILLLNAGVLVVSTLMLVVPTMLISRIKPIKAIRFE